MNPDSKSRVVHEDLDTTFVNLWALLRSLTQRGFIGRVRVELKDYTADVFMTGSSTPLVHEIDRAAGTDTLEEAALHRLVLRAREAPGTISVFEGSDEAVAVQSTARDQGVRGPQRGSPAGVLDPPVNYAADARATPETAAAEISSVESIPTSETKTPSSRMDEPASRESQPAMQGKSDSERPAFSPPPVAESPLLDADPMDETEWTAVVKASGELVGAVERALTNVNADFASLFRAARIELADDYTFLDPMSGEFEYANSVVTLTHDLPANSFVSGLSEALRRVVGRIATGDRARRVRELVALELFSVTRKRNEILTRSGFQAQLDRIAGTKVI
jgi:hypothetical protein